MNPTGFIAGEPGTVCCAWFANCPGGGLFWIWGDWKGLGMPGEPGGGKLAGRIMGDAARCWILPPIAEGGLCCCCGCCCCEPKGGVAMGGL